MYSLIDCSNKTKNKSVNHQVRQSKQNKTKQDHAESFTPISACGGRRRSPNKDEDLRRSRMVCDGESLAIDIEIVRFILGFMVLYESLFIFVSKQGIKTVDMVVESKKVEEYYILHLKHKSTANNIVNTEVFCDDTDMIAYQTHKPDKDIAEDNQIHRYI